MCANERRKYRVQWAKYFKKYLTYKEPYLINGDLYNSIDDDLDSNSSSPLEVTYNQQQPIFEVPDEDTELVQTPFMMSPRSDSSISV